MSFSSAISASSLVIKPGWPKISTCFDSTAALFVPGVTGSFKVSPCTTTILAPNCFALFAIPSMDSHGAWVTSAPKTTVMSQFALMSSIASWIAGIVCTFDQSTWSVIAITSWFNFNALLASSDGNNSPSLNKLCICKSILLFKIITPSLNIILYIVHLI